MESLKVNQITLLKCRMRRQSVFQPITLHFFLVTIGNESEDHYHDKRLCSHEKVFFFIFKDDLMTRRIRNVI